MNINTIHLRCILVLETPSICNSVNVVFTKRYVEYGFVYQKNILIFNENFSTIAHVKTPKLTSKVVARLPLAAPTGIMFGN